VAVAVPVSYPHERLEPVLRVAGVLLEDAVGDGVDASPLSTTVAVPRRVTDTVGHNYLNIIAATVWRFRS